MLTITQEMLDALPGWAAAGWQVGNTLNVATWVNNNSTVQSFMNEHPPHHPNG